MPVCVGEGRAPGNEGRWKGEARGIVEKDCLLPPQNLRNARKQLDLGNSLLEGSPAESLNRVDRGVQVAGSARPHWYPPLLSQPTVHSTPPTPGKPSGLRAEDGPRGRSPLVSSHGHSYEAVPLPSAYAAVCSSRPSTSEIQELCLLRV